MNDARCALRNAARDLIRLAEICPDLFAHVLPINEETWQTLIEIAEFDEEENSA